MSETSSYPEATTQPKDDAELAGQIASLREQIADLARRATEYAAEAGEAGAETVDDSIRQNPYLAVGVALIAGAAIGMALKR